MEYIDAANNEHVVAAAADATMRRSVRPHSHLPVISMVISRVR